MKIGFLLLTFILFLSCETKIYKESSSFDSTALLDRKEIINDLQFSGITSVSNITDSTATIFWDHIDGATEYHIYLVEEENPVYYGRAFAPDSSAVLEGLDSDKEYKVLVRVMNQKGILDTNTETQTIITLAEPSDTLTIKRTFPTLVNDIHLEPVFEITGLKIGEEVKLYSDNCFTEVDSIIATSSTITMTSSPLTPDISYQFHVKRTSKVGIDSDCSTEFATYNAMSCPENYLLIDTGENRGVSEFCVMKYEAKAWLDVDADNFVDTGEVDTDGCGESGCTTENWGLTSFKPGSSSQGQPWRMIDIENAQAECQSLGEHYDLISNREWMVIAEDIEKTATNWSSGIVGTGCLFRGNNGLADACGYNFSGVDSGTDAGRDGKSSLDLSSGDEIIDFSGNLTEWVSWGGERDLEVASFTCNDSWSEISIGFCDGLINPIEFLFQNPAGVSEALYTSSMGLGQLEGGSGNVLARGGAYLYNEYAGVFSGSFAHSKNTARSEIGFRCVFRRSNL